MVRRAVKDTRRAMKGRWGSLLAVAKETLRKVTTAPRAVKDILKEL